MKEVKFNLAFHDEGLYNVRDILANLEEYLGVNFIEFIHFFKDLQIPSQEEIIAITRTNNMKLKEEVLKRNYQYLKKNLMILHHKGQTYLSLFDYLQRMENRDIEPEEQYEKLLDECQVFHFRSILIGADLKRFLIGLGHTLRQTQKYLQQINTPETYQNLLVDSFALTYGASKIYPEEGLVNSGNNPLDKTSIYPKRRKRISNYY